MPIRCARMTAAEVPAAARLLEAFFAQDEFYRDSSGAYGDAGVPPIGRALDKFLQQPELGFVWLAFDGSRPVGICVICHAISTSLGEVVGELDDVFIADGARGKGAGSAMLRALAAELKRTGVLRIDTAVHKRNAEAARFYARLGFKPLHEERLALLL
jgi:GNAT superfamily N-acetyltransferase